MLPAVVDRFAATVLRPIRSVLISCPTDVESVEMAVPRLDKLAYVRTDKLLAVVERPSCKIDKLLNDVVDKLLLDCER